MGPGALVGNFVELLCEQNKIVTTDPVENPFYLNHPPPISLPDFADRLQKYFACSAEAFVVTSLYLRRLYSVRPDLFSPRSAHKLFLSALTVAVKFTDDVSCKQAHYARCGGIEVTELNTLEAKLITEMKYILFVTPENYNESLNILCHLASFARLCPPAASSATSTSTASAAASGTPLVRGSFG